MTKRSEAIEAEIRNLERHLERYPEDLEAHFDLNELRRAALEATRKRQSR